MALSKGQMWTLNKHPLNAYGTAGHAAKRDTSWVVKTVEKGQVKVLDVAWADSAGNVYYPDKGAGTIPIYSVSQVGGLGGLGWIRSDDNLSNSIITNAPSLSAQTGVNNVLTFDKAGEKHTLRININGELVKYITEITSSPVNFQFTQDEVNKILDLMPNVTASDVEYILTTYEGSNIIGDFSRSTKRITIPFDVKPTIDNIVITPINAVDGKLYEKKSSVKVAPSCRPGRGAKINNVFIWVGDFLGLDNPYTSQPFQASGEITIRVMATDTRQRSVQTTRKINVLPFQGISLTNMTSERVLDENATTDYVRVAYHGKAYELDNQNQIQAKIEYQERGQSVWTVAGLQNIGVISNNYSSFFDIQDLSDSKSFNIRLTLTDGLGNQYKFTTTVGTASFPMTWGKHGAGVGVMFDKNNPAALQVGQGGIDSKGPIRINGKAINIQPDPTPIPEPERQPDPFTKGSNSSGAWIKESSGKIISTRQVIKNISNGQNIAETFGTFAFPITMPANTTVYMSIDTTGLSDSQIVEVQDAYSLLQVEKRRNAWAITPTMYAKYTISPRGLFQITSGTHQLRINLMAVGFEP
ncbi:hypothetical protein ACWOA0_05910 [Ignavigranum ruoffiae]